MAKRTCIKGCGEPVKCREHCHSCYKRALADGSLVPTYVRYLWPENLYRRLLFCPPTSMPSGCIEYTGALSPKGYGEISPGKAGSKPAHRAAYELLVGPIPEGLTLDHLCRNKRCVNVGHLEVVTREENVRRAHSRTHCPSGHEFTEANTHLTPAGHRRCKACARASARRSYWKRRGTA
jgi:hypothetical protein